MVAGLFFGVVTLLPPKATAHGKEVQVTVTSLLPDPSQPFMRLYRALVLFEDGDPVEDAVIEITAQREEGGQTLAPVQFYPLNEPGLYATEVTYDRFGNWVVTVTVSEPGEGTASFTDAILPGQVESAESDKTPNTGIPENLAILFKFDGLDFLNIVFRFVHSLAGLAWFCLIGVILVAHWFMAPETKHQALYQLRGFFSPIAGVSLAILLGSGIYNGIWDSPIRPPGVFDLQTMLQVPFGDVYLMAFLGKVLAFAVLAGVTIRLRTVLRDLPTSAAERPSNPAPDGTLVAARLAKIGLGTAIFLVIDIAVLIYMHYISHLAIVIPQ
jgi:hypothetical protein